MLKKGFHPKGSIEKNLHHLHQRIKVLVGLISQEDLIRYQSQLVTRLNSNRNNLVSKCACHKICTDQVPPECKKKGSTWGGVLKSIPIASTRLKVLVRLVSQGNLIKSHVIGQRFHNHWAPRTALQPSSERRWISKMTGTPCNNMQTPLHHPHHFKVPLIAWRQPYLLSYFIVQRIVCATWVHQDHHNLPAHNSLNMHCLWDMSPKDSM